MKPIRLAFVGFGWFAELLMTRVVDRLSEIDVVAVVDPSPARRERAVSLGLFAVESIAELRGHCDAVAILTPHDTHRALVEEAAALGMHVFCEKAFAVTSEDCMAMIETCGRAGVVLAVGHMQKLFPTHARAVEIVNSQQYGPVVAVQISGWHWCPVMPGWWRTAKSCGGLLYWTGIHDLDTLRAIVGAEPKAVYAAAGPKTDPYTEYEDSISVTITYESGIIASIQVAEHDPLRTFEESFTISVLFQNGSLLVDPGKGEVRHASRAGTERSEPVIEQFGSFAQLEEAAYLEEFRRFGAAIANSDADLSTAIDGLRCVELLEAVYRSVESGRVVDVQSHRIPSGMSA
jgi:1,5-anhydro-D-fructose reductase (1,5-anhydro-D-mannitol-forming)